MKRALLLLALLTASASAVLVEVVFEVTPPNASQNRLNLAIDVLTFPRSTDTTALSGQVRAEL